MDISGNSPTYGPVKARLRWIWEIERREKGRSAASRWAIYGFAGFNSFKRAASKNSSLRSGTGRVGGAQVLIQKSGNMERTLLRERLFLIEVLIMVWKIWTGV